MQQNGSNMRLFSCVTSTTSFCQKDHEGGFLQPFNKEVDGNEGRRKIGKIEAINAIAMPKSVQTGRQPLVPSFLDHRVFQSDFFCTTYFFTPQFNCKKIILDKIGRADDVDEVQCEEEDVSGKIIS